MLQSARAVNVVATQEPAEVYDLCALRASRHIDLVARARDELIRGDEDAALELCSKALTMDRSYEALSLAGTLNAILGNLEESVHLTREAIDLRPRRADAYYDLAATFLDMGRPREALPWLERGIGVLGRRDDDLVDFMWSARVEALTKIGRLDDAEAALSDARGRTDDPLGLLDEAESALASRRSRQRLRAL